MGRLIDLTDLFIVSYDSVNKQKQSKTTSRKKVTNCQWKAE